MKLTTPRLLALAAAVVALNACSSEPSDWRPDNKVSVDMVEPGHRVTDNFDLDDEATHEHGEAVEGHAAPKIDADVMHSPDGPGAPAAEAAISANAEEGMRKRGEMHDAGKSTQDDTTAGGHEIQR